MSENTTKPFRHEAQPDVQEGIEAAAAAAVQQLDTLFPGFDNGGISSDFQGVLVQVLTTMLNGVDPLAQSRGHSTHLHRHIFREHNFSSHARCSGHDLFMVVAPGSPQYSMEAHRRVTPLMALNASGNGFTFFSSEFPLEQPAEGAKVVVMAQDLERLDPFTSVEAASRALVDFASSEGYSAEEAAALRILPVEFHENHWRALA